jgi:D-glycero-beta-D-manno-heptose-7-phosphate kinase
MKELDKSKIFEVLERFDRQQITVTGDLMLDHYIFGKVERISPEAPVPVVCVTHERSVPGGAANVAMNLSLMKANINLCGIIGKDAAGEQLLRELQKREISTQLIRQFPDRTTTKKVRILGHNQNLLRIDYEDITYLDKQNSDELYYIMANSPKTNYLIISDYAKGSLTPENISRILLWAKENGTRVVIDPKPVHQEYYRNCYLITPNKKEAEEMAGLPVTDNASLQKCGAILKDKLNCLVVITLGEQGMAVFSEDGSMKMIPARAREVYDVSGAGDTVVAALALSLSAGAPLIEAAEIANCAAGIKVSKLGTHPVSKNEIKNFLNSSL